MTNKDRLHATLAFSYKPPDLDCVRDSGFRNVPLFIMDAGRQGLGLDISRSSIGPET